MSGRASEAAKTAASPTQSSPGRPEYTRAEPEGRKEGAGYPSWEEGRVGRGREEPGPGPSWEPAWHPRGKVRAKQGGREKRAVKLIIGDQRYRTPQAGKTPSAFI